MKIFSLVQLTNCYCSLKKKVDAFNPRTDEEIRAIAEAVRDERLPFTFHAEDNGTLVTGRLDLSFGNGNENVSTANAGAWGIVMPHDYTILCASFGSRTAVDGNGASVALTRNVGGQNATPVTIPGSDILIPAGQRSGIITYAAPITGAAGDALNFITTNPGGNDLVGFVAGYFSL